jgi:flagellar M-ring protein FliF
MGRIQQAFAQLWAFLMAQPPARRVTIAVVGLGTIGLVLGAAYWVQQPVYRPLFTNLSQADAGAIVAALKAEKVPFQIEDGGRAVLVPSERLYELRLSLASKGLPEGGGVGFEIFDKQTLGQTDFLQRLNYQRALQGELGRTISQLGGVESARVHLAIPEHTLFVTESRRPSASVVVKLAQGRTLSSAQVDGIVHLVAASVEGLATENVTVVDEGGRVLTSDHHGGESTGASSAALEYQGAVEHTAAERIESMLVPVVGRDKVIARVSAAIDFSRVERTEETYDPERAALHSQHTTREQTTGPRTQGGAVGAQANLTNEAGGGGAGAAGNEGPKSDRRDETQSYDVSKVVSRTIAPVGVVKQLTVSVLVDGTYNEEAGKKTFVPRPQEELDRLKELVKNAVGFSEERGDKIEVSSVAFQTEPLPAAEGTLGAVGRWAPWVIRWFLSIGIAVGGLFFFVRPLLLAIASRPRLGGGGFEELMGNPGADAAVARLTRENLAIAQESPERAAQLIREWIEGGV